MTKVIWKHKLMPTAFQAIRVPHGAKMLTAQLQNGEPCVWFECDPQSPLEDRHIIVLMTGHEYDGDPGRYLGTLLHASDTLVFHVFEAPH